MEYHGKALGQDGENAIAYLKTLIKNQNP